MKVWTFKTSPKAIFGLILVVTGLLVVLITFFSNHINRTENTSASVSCATQNEREKFLSDFGWELGEHTEKELVIPKNWDKVYEDYNEIQLSQGFDLSKYKGKTVTLYTYEITNYDGIEEGILADLLVYEGKLIGGDICNTSAESGFLHAFEKKK